MARPIPLGIRRSDRPSDSQIITKRHKFDISSLIVQNHITFQPIRQSLGRVLAESIPLNLLAAPTDNREMLWQTTAF
jgi:hypothetical protein